MKKIFFSLLILLVSISLFSCKEEKEIVINADQTFEIHTEFQKQSLSGEYNLISLYAGGKAELSLPMPITLTWDKVETNNYIFSLSENEDFSGNFFITKELDTNTITIYNLKIHTLYYWNIQYYVDGILTKSETKTLVIENTTPRNLYVEGLTNVRDIGGYRLGVNKYVKQGMIYRSSRLNENETTTNLITEEGIKVMKEQLLIKSELDIRRVDNNENGGITVSPLGADVNYYSVPMKSGGNLLLLNQTVIKDAFKILADENNYPIVIHCSIGTDRTGMLCFLINALLGVSKDDLYSDFLFSNFGNIGGSRAPSIIDTYLRMIETMEGDTLATQTYNYLLSIGVSESDLNKVISIMV